MKRMLLVAAAAILCCACGSGTVVDRSGYVVVDGKGFAVDGEPWFPLMLNYKVSVIDTGGSVKVEPPSRYTSGSMADHFDTIAAWGFNAIRLCIDDFEPVSDTAVMFDAVERAVCLAGERGLRVMLLIQAPFGGYWSDYAKGLMTRLSNNPTVWAYDLMNEPLYFDPKPHRSKQSALRTVRRWCKMVRRYAPRQLFTVALAEPIEVFAWDASLLDVDFVEMHTYHPLRVQSEMYWYSRYCGKAWIVGETGLPADDSTVSYAAQADFLRQTYSYAVSVGAAGYGWWEFQDAPHGVNFEAQYTGLRDGWGGGAPPPPPLWPQCAKCPHRHSRRHHQRTTTTCLPTAIYLRRAQLSTPTATLSKGQWCEVGTHIGAWA